MNNEAIDNFLKKRSEKINLIEIANAICEKIGSVSSESFLTSLDSFDDGCIKSFLNYTQKILTESIFTNIIAIIGNYKKNNLTAWEKIPFCNDREKKLIISQLKSIRARYAEARNSIICHVDDNMLYFHCHLTFNQITEDIKLLRNVFNEIRKNNGLPTVITLYSAHDHYPMIGLNNIITILQTGNNASNHLKTSAEHSD